MQNFKITIFDGSRQIDSFTICATRARAEQIAIDSQREFDWMTDDICQTTCELA